MSSVLNAGEFATGNLRLETLVRLRWLAVAGQTVAVLFVAFVLGFDLPIVACLGLVALSAVVNLVLRVRYPASQRLPNTPASVLLGYDVLQLGALLFLTGGLENPFSVLLLVPVIVSATTLAPRQTILLGGLVVAVASLIGFAHWPLPWHRGATIELAPIYTAGVWIALVSACIFTGVYAFRVAEEARQLARALNATEMVLAREQHLYALDGLAAAAAHELGTPLATIALVAKELENDFPAGSPHSDDIALLKSQSQRCRDILAKLASLSSQVDHHLSRQPLSHLVEEVVAPYRDFAARIVVAPSRGSGPEPVGRHNPAVVQGLANLVENAVDFARSEVEVAAEWDDDRVAVTIRDDGPGFAPGIIDRIGEPYLTTRAQAAGELPDHEAGGLGLGVFIAKTLLERTGARLHLVNRDPPETGAIVRVEWPRAAMDIVVEARRMPETIADGTTWRGANESV